MRRTIVFLSLLCLVLTGAASAKVTLPEATTLTLDNGLMVQVIERHNLPLFSMQLTCRAGSIFDPVGKEGLAAVASEMLMRGTPTRNTRQIAEEIAYGGGAFSNFCSRVSAGFQGEFLTAQGEKGFEILGDILTNSLLSQEELDKTVERQLAAIENAYENPGNIANIKMSEVFLGDSRYAHATLGLKKTVAALTRDDLTRYVADFYAPNNALLVICGDITPQQATEWARKYLGAWKGAAGAPADEPAFPPIEGKQVIIFDKPDATQAQIRIGGNGFPIDSPDYWAYEVASNVYGGSFTSRLVNEIRVNRGLTYGVRCSSTSFKPGGIVYVTTFTKNSTVGEVIDIILAEARRMQTEMLSDSEFVGAVKYRSGLYPLGFETNDDLVGVFANMWLNSLDKSHYEDYQENLKAGTSQQALEVAQEYFPFENYRLILVGKADEIKAQAEKYGPVTVVPLSVQ